MIRYRRVGPANQPLVTALFAWEQDDTGIYYAVTTVDRLSLSRLTAQHGWRALRAFWKEIRYDLQVRVWAKENRITSPAQSIEFGPMRHDSFANVLLRGMLLVERN